MQITGSGLCSKRLGFAQDYLRRIVDEGKVAGAGGVVIRHDAEAFCFSAGLQDIKKKLPMRNDSIYRVYSMTKPITVVAAMTLYEKGLFRLHQSIADFIPAFKEMSVAETSGQGVVRIVPAKRPLTFEHLFTMTSGIPYSSDEHYPGRTMADVSRKSNKAAAEGRPWDTARTIEEVAKLPLCFHPGEQWLYGFSHDVLGRLVEIISGKKLSVFLKETIFDPLGMSDTAFFIPEEKQPRAAAAYQLEKNTLRLVDLGNDPALPKPPSFESGGGGLCSTMTDYARFAQMLLHNGKCPDGKERILSRKTIDLIRTRHVDLALLDTSFFPHMKGYGYGLGVRTMLDTAQAGLNGSVGEWAWDGMLGTYFLVDPSEDMTALFFIQLSSEIINDLQRGFVQTVYGAIDD